jgi:hypothetical protein
MESLNYAMLVACISDFQTARCHILQRQNLQIQRHEKFTSENDLEFLWNLL